MLSKIATRLICAGGTLILLGGCQNVGPISIDQGRDRYNSIIQSTSKEQTFANIIRVYHHEPTVFMDVTEVDATTTFSGSVTGGLAGIGARAGTSGGTLAGKTGAVTGGVTYSESPLIRYQPLLGQGLVAQMVTPVSPDVIWSLYDSNWGIAPILDLSTSYLVPDYDETAAALNTIAKLDYDETLELVAEKSDVTKAKDSTKSGAIGTSGNVTLEVTNKSSGGGGTDALGIYFLSYHPHLEHRETPDQTLDKKLWQRLVHLYEGTQVPSCPQSKPAPAKAGETKGTDVKEAVARAASDAAAAARAAADAADKVAAAATAAAGGGAAPAAPAAELIRSPIAVAPAGSATQPENCRALSDYIELRTMPVAPKKIVRPPRTGAPTMRTYSALGILKNATEQPWPKIAFVDIDRYLAISSPLTHPWNNQKTDVDLNFYTLLPDDEAPNGNDEKEKDKRTPKYKAATDILVRWLHDHRYRTEPPLVYWREYLGDDEFVYINTRLGQLRRYVLIITSDNPPPNAYVAHFDQGVWYYIDAADEISQKNFDLISLFMTMMAVPSTTPPLAPVISAGGG